MCPRLTRLLALALLTVTLALASPPAALAQDDGEVRALWVDSFNPGLRSPAQIDGLIDRATRGNFNTIIAQVRRNAQGLYAISPEGWVENYVPPENFDPLQDLINKGHAAGLEVHAWVNIGPIYTGHPLIKTGAWPCKVPCDPNHVFNRHGWGVAEPDYWLTRTHPNYTAGMHAHFPRERTRAGLWFIDLGHPGAAEYTTGVLTHLLRTYDVDGIHLDYIRYPEMPIVSPRPPRVGLPFSTGYNPTSVARFNAAYGRAEGSIPDPWDPSWSNWRRDQVTAFVRRLYLEMHAVRPSAKLSAALITFWRGPNTAEPRTFQQTEPYIRVFQDWKGWMEEGALDLAIPMIYKSQHFASNRIQYSEWIEFTKEAQYDRHGVIGLGAFLNSIENTLVQMAQGRLPSATGEHTRGFNFFSYNATNRAAGGRPLRPRDELFRALTEDGAYTAEAPFRNAVAVPPMAWKTNPRQGHLLAQILGKDGLPADGARVVIRRLGSTPGTEEITQYADGNGFVGGIDLEPGAYQLAIATPSGEDRVTIPQPVVPGKTTRVSVNLSRPARGPLTRAPHTFGAHERLDHLDPEGASDLEEWRGHEPVPEDLIPPPVE